MTLFSRLWHDEDGAVMSTELILLTTLVVIGILVGLVAMRDALVQELGDSGAAINAMNQSYAVEVPGNSVDPSTGTSITVSGDTVTFHRDFPSVQVSSSFSNFGYEDKTDVGDDFQRPGRSPAGIVMGQPEMDEGDPLPRLRP